MLLVKKEEEYLCFQNLNCHLNVISNLLTDNTLIPINVAQVNRVVGSIPIPVYF